MDIYGNISTIWYPLVVAIELHGQSIPFQSVKLPAGKQNGWLVFMLIGWLTIKNSGNNQHQRCGDLFV